MKCTHVDAGYCTICKVRVTEFPNNHWISPFVEYGVLIPALEKIVKENEHIIFDPLNDTDSWMWTVHESRELLADLQGR